MGAPVSKLDNHGKASETSHEQSTDGHLHENKSTCNDVIFDSEKNDGSCETIPKPPEQESEMLQVLCAAADDIDDQEWGDIYKRLKTNRNDDLHIVNARFTRNDLSAFPDGSVKTIGPVFTSTVAERPTRINSANFSPHAIEYEREKSRIKIAIRRRTELTEDEVADEEECEPIVDKTMDAQKETLERELSDSNRDYDNSQNNLEGEHSTSLEKACVNIEQVNDDNVKKPPVVARENQLMLPGENSLLVPADNRGMQSPAPNLQERNTTADADDDDFDPFEGLDIPRQRAYSIGSASIYSVMEISDDMYQLYRAEIKSCIRSYGFFEAFPSPAIISEAQKIYRMLDIPSPVDDDGHILPHPPKVTKNEYLEAETKSFDDVRDKIDKMPDMLKVDGETSDIVPYLCEGLDDDMSKLRIIAAWIVLQQLEVSVDKNKKKETSERWCKLFKIMCKFARIKTRLIKGIIRGPTYVPGEDLQLNRGYWIAVLINYTWLLVDPALKQDINEETNNHTHKTRTNVNLFDNVARIFQDPEEFIFTHFPDDEHWQLLARPVTKDELTEMAVLRPGFFAFDMTVINCPKSVMVVNSAETLISLAFREGILLQFKCKLQLCDNSMSLARSRRYVFLETLLKDHLVNIRVRFPSKGSYILHLIGSFDDENWQSVISYRLDNKGQTASDPFPDSPREEWGPGMDTVKMGLTPHMYHSGEILMQKRVIQIAFSDTERLQFDHVLFRDDININPDYLKVSVMKDKNNDVIFIIDIDSKVTGTFTLQLLARADRRADYTNFCNYLIRKEKRVIIPKLEFNRKDNSSDRDVIQAPDSGELHLTVDATGLIQLTVELKLHDRQELNFSEHARHWICNNTGFIDLNFPRKGKYTMQVLGRTVQKGRFRPVREETIHASIPSARWSCWPKEGANWNSWYKIEAPLSHHLEEKEDITFKVEVKNALDVAVLAANGWYHLDRVDESWLWAGKVWTGPKSTRCRLLTRFEIGSEKWSELLWFKIMAEEDFERMAVRQSSAREIAYKERTGDGT